MKTLLDVQDELRLAWLLVECAWMAWGTIEAAEPAHAVLDAACDKLREIGQAIEALLNTSRN